MSRAARPGRVRRLLPLLGPAFVAAVAYVDPGNFATGAEAGAGYGYALLWVVVAANLMAVLVQSQSAKLGLATGRNLPEVCRDRFPRPVVRGLWLQAEAVAMATDLAEVVGGALALHLLFGVPLLEGGLITGAVAFALLAVHQRDQRRFERVVTVLLAVILVGFALQLWSLGADGGQLATGLVPSFPGEGSALVAAGLLGATVMPHAVYLHSDLARRNAGDPGPAGDPLRSRALRAQRVDVAVALGLAGLVNAAILVVAARLADHVAGADSVEGVHAALGQVVGPAAAVAFGLALLVSGFASSGVGTYAGQVVLQGFLQRRIPVVLRRALTLAPALVVLALGVDPSRALVLSQVVLSFGLPFALVPLVLLTRRRDVMGALVDRPVTTVAACAVTAVVVTLNVVLLVDLLGG